MSTKLHELHEQGQSAWLDYIRRSFIVNGDLKSLVDDGVRGVTSNPSIFEEAIGGSDDYDEDLAELASKNMGTEAIYEALAIKDIQLAADVLRPVYDASNGTDGYVSLEVNPTLAHDTEGTIAAGRRLFAAVDRPNVMIKVPATPEGIPAIQTLTDHGININATLIFSLQQYDDVALAYIAGLESLAKSGGDVSRISSVASFFVSRVETKVDKALEAVGRSDLQGKTAVANAKMAYQHFLKHFSGERWSALAEKGAQVQRPLWASTSTKNPDYPDTLYVDTLIGPHTVNTMPNSTLEAFMDHGELARTVDQDIEAATSVITEITRAGVDLPKIMDELLTEGVQKFADSFLGMLDSVAEERAKILANDGSLIHSLGELETAVSDGLNQLQQNNIIERIWQIDHTVWKPDPTEISNRLGWLTSADLMLSDLDRLHTFVNGVREDGFNHVLLLGMGGSSLAPELFSLTFGAADGYPTLDILDTTDPDAVGAKADSLDFEKTLFIVATKSGGTAETLSFFKYFYNKTAAIVGEEAVGDQFVAITDPGSKLEKMADAYGFRAIFLNDPNIGGRYSALSYFGIVPAALLGIDLARLLQNAQQAAQHNKNSEGSAALIGTIMAKAAQAGKDKLTFLMPEKLASFGDWAEQLIAESTGKEGKGILPVVTESAGDPSVYGNDRLFVQIKLLGEPANDKLVSELEAAGHPVFRLFLQDLYDLGGQFLVWELATAVAGFHMDINPFDQPNVEAAKKLARKMIDAYEESGELPNSTTADLSREVLKSFLSRAEAGSYVAIHAYVPPTPETTDQLQKLSTHIRNHYKLATTIGYGPRFLHSTGQLHKGDAGNGLFIQFTSDAVNDIEIPDEAGQAESSMTFGVLKLAQAIGDGEALRDADRAIIRFHLGHDIIGGLKKLTLS